MYLKAQDHEFEGDEENAYVFYMRYFNIITLIKRSNKYKEKKVSKGLEKLGKSCMYVYMLLLIFYLR